MSRLTIEDYETHVNNAIERLTADPDNKEYAMHLYNFKTQLKAIMQLPAKEVGSKTKIAAKKLVDKINKFQDQYYGESKNTVAARS